MLSAMVLSVQAHPGHDLLAHGAGHVATSPYHLVVLLGLAFACFALGQMARHIPTRRFFRYAGVTALAAAATLWGFSA